MFHLEVNILLILSLLSQNCFEAVDIIFSWNRLPCSLTEACENRFILRFYFSQRFLSLLSRTRISCFYHYFSNSFEARTINTVLELLFALLCASKHQLEDMNLQCPNTVAKNLS